MYYREKEIPKKSGIFIAGQSGHMQLTYPDLESGLQHLTEASGKVHSISVGSN